MNQTEGGAAPVSGEDLRGRAFRKALPRAVLALLPILLVLSSAGAGFTLLGSDMMAGSYHIRGLVGRLLGEGRLPVWDSHAMCGFPMLAAMQAGVLYPLTWLTVVLDPGPFWTVTVLIHLVLAGQFAFGWLTRGLKLGTGAGLVGACVFMLSGYILTRVLGGHISQICGYPWLAAILWRTECFLDRPTLHRWILLAASVALLILPGFPQFVLIAALFMLVRLAAFQVRAGRAGLRTMLLASAAGAAGGLFCAPQLLSTIELLPEVQRVAGSTYEFSTQLSLTWQNLLGLVAPAFFGDDLGTAYWSRGAIWEATGFVGVGGLILAVLALGGGHPQRRFWAVAAVLALLLALGSTTFVYGVFFHAVPGFKLFRQPGRYLAVFTVALAALSALGFERLWKDGADVRRAARFIAIGSAVVLAGILASLAVVESSAASGAWERYIKAQFRDPECMVSESDRQDPGFPERARLRSRAALAWSSVPLGLLAIGLLAYSGERLSARTGAILAGVVVAVELTAFGHGYLKPQDPAAISWPPEFVTFMKSAPGAPSRMASPAKNGILHIGKCQLAGLDHVSGYESMQLRRYAELINVIHGRSPEAVLLGSTVKRPHPVLDMLGARFWLLPQGMAVPPGWRAVGTVNEGMGQSVVLESPQAFPRAFIVPGSVSIPSRDERLRVLMNPSTDLRKTVVLETESPSTGAEGSGTVRIESFAEGWYQLSTDSASGGILVLTETYYPGWEARIDGAPAEVLRANHLVQAVRIPAGRHSVRFEYHPRMLRPGFLVSLTVVLAVCGAAWKLRRPAAGTP